MDIPTMELVNISVEKVIRKAKPICFLGHSLVLGKLNKIYLVDTETYAKKLLLTLPLGFKRKVFGMFSWLTRLFRLGVNTAIVYNNRLFMVFDKKLFSYNIDSSQLTCEIEFAKGKGPLAMSVVSGIKGFNDGIYFGEYINNPDKQKIDVFYSSGSGAWDKVYTFAAGLINHIHAIVPDPFRNCVWILTGDFEHAPGFWRADNMFKDVVPVVAGSQQYRSCVAFATEEGLLYATDTQFESNHIRLLKQSNGKWESEPLARINGSCIYGCAVGDQFVFATSTEPVAIKHNKLLDLLQNKPGPGIEFNESHIIAGNMRKGFRIISKNKKDILPYKLFQFGAIMFPSGKNPSNKLFSYSVANTQNDLSTEVRSLAKTL